MTETIDAFGGAFKATDRDFEPAVEFCSECDVLAPVTVLAISGGLCPHCSREVSS